jgi:hypothetical protein
MKTMYYSIAFLLLSLFAQAQENSPFVTGFEETISSKILGNSVKSGFIFRIATEEIKSKTEEIILYFIY